MPCCISSIGPRAALWLALALLLPGCALLGGKPRTPTTVYAPTPQVQADAAWPRVEWQLSLTTPTAARTTDSQRIAVRPTPNELEVYKSASWARRPTEMVEDVVLRALEDSGRIPAVARQGSGIGADYKLVLDLRRFESDYAGQAVPRATVEVNAKLLHAQEQTVVASRTFVQALPAQGTAVPQVVVAFEQALSTVGHDIAGWVLVAGDAHQRSRHR